jgi:hypothetical protein
MTLENKYFVFGVGIFVFAIIIAVPVHFYDVQKDGPGSLAAEILLVLVIWIEGLIAWMHLKSDRESSRKEEELHLLLEINRQIEDFRNDKEMREVRRKLQSIMDDTTQSSYTKNERLLEWWNDQNRSQDFRRFLARLNNLCWTIEQCPATAWARMADVFAENLLREWEWLAPLIKQRRKERGEDIDNGWYAHNMQNVVKELVALRRMDRTSNAESRS